MDPTFDALISEEVVRWSARMQFADWLTERGDTRGELIRLEQRRFRASDQEEARLRTQAGALRAAHEAQWRAGLEVPVEATLQWRLGFVVGLRWRARNRVDSGAELERLIAVLRHPSMRHVFDLDIYATRIDAEGAVRLASAGVLDRIRRLGLRVVDLDAAALKRLVPELGAVEELDLFGNELGEASAAVLRGSPGLDALSP